MDQNKSISKSNASPIKAREVSDITVQILEGIRPPKNKKKNTGLTKAEIGELHTFQHVQGTSKTSGYDENSGFDKGLLALEGVSETDIGEEKTRSFIAGCIYDHDDVLAVNTKNNAIEEPSNNAKVLEDETQEVDIGTLKKNENKKRLSKANIGEPYNFQHLYGFSKTCNENNERDKEFSALTGVSEIDMRNRKTQSCIASISNDHEDVLLMKLKINSIENSNSAKLLEDETLKAYFGTLNKSKPKKRLSKAEIGYPHNFEHLFSISKTSLSNVHNGLDDGGLIHNLVKDYLLPARVSETDLRDKKRRSCIADFSNDHDDTFTAKSTIENFLNSAKVPVDETREVDFSTLKKNQLKKRLTLDEIGEPFDFRHVDGFSKTSVDKDILALEVVSETDLRDKEGRLSCIAGSSNDHNEVFAENKQVLSQIQDNREADKGTSEESELLSVPGFGEPYKFKSGNKELDKDGLTHNGDLTLADVSETDQRVEETRPSIAGFTKEIEDVLVVKENNNVIENLNNNHNVPVDEAREVGFSILKKNQDKKKPTKVEIGKPYNFQHVAGFSKVRTGNIEIDVDGPIPGYSNEAGKFLNLAEESFIADHEDVTTLKKGVNVNENPLHNANVQIQSTTRKENGEWINLKLIKDTISNPSNFKHVNAACFPP